ncbi:prolyl oligopeptidase family serine peptidase [Dactylosporangium sucinum]|uniref:prolyl oligopeptidase n=1 Tax=Dactylosporangium sucinum TaxID=1424081 RepID=A0A917UA34_9ACTN|nr:prolyl oligopeptidase family serine peptidase [Dactylosporangium sucinum]GGM69740.1 peptidase S9 [Dactylosporangium sucinum]
MNSSLEAFGLAVTGCADQCGAVRFNDPYRMLEDETVPVRRWQHHQSDSGRDKVHALVGTDRLAELTAELRRHLDTVPSGPHLGRHRVGADRRTVLDRDTLCWSVTAVSDDGDEEIDWLVPSPDGALLAIGVTAQGDEQTTLHLVPTADGRQYSWQHGPIRNVGSLVWVPDSSGAFLTKGLGDHEKPLKRLHHLDLTSGSLTMVPAPEAVASARMFVQLSADGRLLAAASTAMHPRVLGILDRASHTWYLGPDNLDGHVLHGDFVGSRYAAVTSLDAPTGRIVSLEVSDIATPARWRELVPASTSVLRALRAWGDRLVVSELREGRPALFTMDADGAGRRPVPVPAGVAVCALDGSPILPAADPPVLPDGRALVFTGSEPSGSVRVWRFDPGTGTTRALTESRSTLPPLAVERHAARAEDGHVVRYDTIRLATLPPDAPLPHLLTGYGGFNQASLTGTHPGPYAPWLLAGGALTFAHARGDATFGYHLWRDGRRAHKQHTFNDVYAVADHLIATGRADPRRLALAGASNGGLLVAVAITQRPDLFAAAAALVPITDMNRLYRERFPETFRPEYGDPRVEAEAAWLRRYSPYHNVRSGVDYPPTIIVGGDRDMRIHAWHARKLWAALVDNAARPEHIVLRVHERAGHLTTGRDAARVAEWLGFLMAHTGLGGRRSGDVDPG